MASSLNYLAYWGLTEEPFRLTPDREFYYASPKHQAVEETIRFGVEQGDGFIITLGEVGTGKTMLIRCLLKEWRDKFAIAFLISPQLTPRQLLQAILSDLGLEKQSSDRMSLGRLLMVLNDYLFRLAQNGRKLLIIIDEAQNLPDDSLEQLRLLSNFESDKDKWLQIILVGQPELGEKLARRHLRQLLQRVTVMETLQPLSKDEMLYYVQFRLARAGRADFQLDRRFARELWRFTGGVPRLINKIMDRALLIGYARQRVLDRLVVREAATFLYSGTKPIPVVRLWPSGWLVPLAATLLAVFTLIYFQPW